jgi:hypothetical protein
MPVQQPVIGANKKVFPKITQLKRDVAGMRHSDGKLHCNWSGGECNEKIKAFKTAGPYK